MNRLWTKFTRWWKSFSGRLSIYAIIVVGIGIGVIFLWYLGHKEKLSEANPYDIATFLIVIAGAGIALVAQEVSGRVQIAGFRRLWTEELRDLIAKFSGLMIRYSKAAPAEKVDLSDQVISLSSKILLMLTDLRAISDPDHPHKKLEDQIIRILGVHSLSIDRDLITFARPVLKEGWMQTVEEVRLQ